MMRKHTRTRIGSILLVITMLLSMLPITASAEGEAFSVSGGTKDIDYTYSETENREATLKILTDTPIVLSGSGKLSVQIPAGVEADLTLNDVTMSPEAYTVYSGITIAKGGSLCLTLEGANSIQAGFYAGIEVPYGASLEIKGTGSLEVSGGNTSAAIGEGPTKNGWGNITISGGTIVATGSTSGAGIGGAGGSRTKSLQTGAITISNGSVRANGGSDGGAGIGTGANKAAGGKEIKDNGYVSAGTIRITGGTVVATGSTGAADIGGGKDADGGDIRITGGDLTGVDAFGTVGNGCPVEDTQPDIVQILGGTYGKEVDISSYVPNGMEVVENSDGTVSVQISQDAAVEIDGIGYESLESAVAVANVGDTVKLRKGIQQAANLTIAADKDIVLDLNGQALEMGSKKINVSGNLTIMDGATNGTISGTAGQMISIQTGGAVLLESGTVITTGYGAVRTNTSSTFTMTGGTVQGSPAIQALNGSVSITGGFVEVNAGTSYLAIENSSAAITVGAQEAVSQETPVIEGLNIGTNKTALLYSGTISKAKGAFAGNSVLTCRFGENIADALPAGYTCVQEDAYWKVTAQTEDGAVAQIMRGDGNSVYVSSVGQLSTSLVSGDTLRLLQDLTGDTSGSILKITVPGVTVDLNGHSVTNQNAKGYGISFEIPYGVHMDTTASVQNSAGTQAAINAATPLRFKNGDSAKKIEATLGDGITLETSNNQKIELGTGAYLRYSQTAADAIANGGFRATDVDGNSYIFGRFTDAMEADANHTAVMLNDYTGTDFLGTGKCSGILDLNGKKYVTSGKKILDLNQDGAVLTVKNGTLESIATGGEDTDSFGVGTLYDDVTLNLENVNIVMHSDNFAVVTNGTNTGITFNITGGSIQTTENSAGIYFPSSESTLTIDGTSVTGGTGVAVKGGTVTIRGNAVIQGTGAKVTPSEPENSGVTNTGDALYVEGNYADRSVVVNIESGTFTSTNGYAVQKLFAESSGEAEEKTIAISGGSFSTEIPEDYCADGMVPVQNGGTWGVKTVFASGTGTENDPYHIATEEQLKTFRDSVNSGSAYEGKYIQLDADIDLSGEEWEPIGITKSEEGTVVDYSFQGIFNGIGHAIRNLTMTSVDTDKPYYNTFNTGYACYGFFGGVDGGTVKNLRFADVTVDKPGADVNNSTAAAAVGAAVNGATLSNITVESGSVTGHSRAAGVVGFVGANTNTGTSGVGDILVESCTNNAVIASNHTSDSYGTAGGVCATANTYSVQEGAVTFRSNRNTGSVSGYYAAGILASTFAYNDCSLDLIGNTNTGAITVSAEASGTSAAGIAVAGVAGTIESNVNSGTIDGKDGMAGGILTTAGYDTVFSAAGNRNTSAISGRQAGGIVAVVDGAELKNLTNSGSVNGAEQAGGVAALIRNGATLDGSTCVGNGTVTGAADSNYVGKLVGNVAVEATLENLTDSDAIGAVTVGGNAAHQVTLDKVQLDTLHLVAGHNQGFTYTMNLTNGSSIGTLMVNGAVHTGMTLEIAGGTVQLVEVTGMTGNTEDGDVKTTTLNFSAADGAQIGILRTTDASNKLVSLKVAADSQSTITTVEAASAVAAGFGHGAESDDNPNTDERAFPNEGTIQTVKTSEVNYITTNMADNHAPDNVWLVTGTLTEDAAAILGGTITGTNKTGFTGVKLTADTTLGSSLSVVSGKTLVIAKDVTLTIPNGTALTNNGAIINYGTIDNQNEGGGSTGTVTNRYIVTFQDVDGTVLSTQDVAENEKVTRPADPERDGYVFEGWYLNNVVYDFEIQVTAHLTLTARWSVNSSGSSGGSSDPTYAISMPSKVTGGEISLQKRYAEKGEIVTITVTPDDGYELDKLIVTDSKGNVLELTNKGSGKFTFKMPAGRVEIEASFREVALVNPFVDVGTNDYYYNAVLWAVEHGVTAGTGANTFSPNAAVSRAQMVTFLWRAHGSPKATGTNPFTDVSTNDYYYDAVLWAVANGVTAGTSSTTFSPNADVTRSQAVMFQWRAAGSPTASGNGFGDVAADAWYYDAVSWAVANGITSGTGGNNFSPDVVVSRGQAVTFLYHEFG